MEVSSCRMVISSNGTSGVNSSWRPYISMNCRLSSSSLWWSWKNLRLHSILYASKQSSNKSLLVGIFVIPKISSRSSSLSKSISAQFWPQFDLHLISSFCWKSQEVSWESQSDFDIDILCCTCKTILSKNTTLELTGNFLIWSTS